MELIFRHSWIFLVVMTVANGITWWIRGAPTRREHPERVSSYRRLVTYFIIGGNLPWLMLAGAAIFDDAAFPVLPLLLQPPTFWGIACYASLYTVLSALVYYVFRRGGAEELSQHPGLTKSSELNRPAVWKAVAVGGLVWNIIMLFVFMAVGDNLAGQIADFGQG